MHCPQPLLSSWSSKNHKASQTEGSSFKPLMGSGQEGSGGGRQAGKTFCAPPQMSSSLEERLSVHFHLKMSVSLKRLPVSNATSKALEVDGRLGLDN